LDSILTSCAAHGEEEPNAKLAVRFGCPVLRADNRNSKPSGRISCQDAETQRYLQFAPVALRSAVSAGDLHGLRAGTAKTKTCPALPLIA